VTGFYHYHRSWNDDLSLPFAALPGIHREDQGRHQHRAPTEQLISEREALVADYRELLDTDEDRATTTS
jgi:pyruvate,water dikinase